MKRRMVWGALPGLVALPLMTPAFAADYAASTREAEVVDPARASVAERPRPDYQPAGIRLGSFLFYPTLLTSLSYDDNITAVGTDTKSDWIFVAKPSFLLESDWFRHSLAFEGSFESGTYFKYSDGDYQNYSIGTRGRIDVNRDMSVSAYARFLHGNELPGDGETDTEIAVPLPYDTTTAGVRLDNKFNRIWTIAAFDFEDTSYDTWLDGAPTDQQYRDGQTYTLWGRVGYEISPLTSVFVGGRYETTSFEDSNYDGEEYVVTTGVKFEPTRLMRGEAYVGYKNWQSDSGYLDDISGFTFGGDLAWFASPLLTVTVTADQTIDGSNFTYAGIVGSSILTTNAGVRVDYEFRRNVLLAGWFGYQQQDYEDFPREDQKYTYGTSLKYLINRYVTAGLQYTYTDFDSNFNGINGVESYNRSIVLGSLKFTY